MQTALVMREKQFNMRFSAEEWSAVEALSERYGMNAAELFRMLLKREAALVTAEPARFDLQREHLELLEILVANSDGCEVGDLAIEMNGRGWDAKWGGLGRTLNDLRRESMITKRGGKWVATVHGRLQLNTENEIDRQHPEGAKRPPDRKVSPAKKR